MSTIISGSTPSSFGDDLTAVDITCDSLTVNSVNIPNGSVVGYQQGTWSPSLVSTTVSGGALAGTPYSGRTWNRIGSLVTLNYTFNVSGGTPGSVNVNDSWVFSGVPYNIEHFGQTLSQGWSTGDWNSGNRWIIQAFVYDNNGTNNIKWGGTFAGNGSVVRAGMSWRCVVQYTTDDTTWTPLNGATIQ